MLASRYLALSFISLLIAIASSGARADTANAAETQDIKSIQDRLSKLEGQVANDEQGVSPEAEELQKLKLEIQLPEEIGPRFTGLGAGMSKVYFSRTPLSVGAFVDLRYLAPEGGTKSSNISRFDTMVAYKFSRSLIANTAMSFQNGGVNAGAGTALVEYAYIDFLIHEDAGIRVGNLLVPVGVSNLRFEPNLFPTVRRPGPETAIIPSTWNENGIIAFGRMGAVVIQGGVLNGGDASHYKAANWIRGGRQAGANAKAQNTAWVARAEWLDNEESSLGTSVYYGSSNQSDNRLGRSEVTLFEAHDEFQWNRFTGKIQYIDGWLTDTDKIFLVTGEAVGRRARGGEVKLAYDLLPRLAPIAKRFVGHPPPPGWKSLPVFLSWENVNPQVETPEGATADPKLRYDTYTVGFNYKPHPQVVLKADYATQTTGAGDTTRTYELGLGFVF